MKKNVGRKDAAVRLLLMIIISVLLSYITVKSVSGVVLTAVGLILLLTAAVERCPLYGLFGISTRSEKLIKSEKG